MFNPIQADARNFFFTAYKKYKSGKNLDDHEKIAINIIIEHPEFDIYLSNPDKYIDYQWLPESEEINPFLHLGMHMGIIEQLSIDQPPGIAKLYNKLCKKLDDVHKADHEMMECLAKMIWHSLRNRLPPDINAYLKCIKNKL